MVNPDRIPIEPRLRQGASAPLPDAGPVRIRGLEIAGPLWLAPMAHYTNRATRIMARRFGAHFVYTEMIAAPHFIQLQRGRRFRRIADFGEEERPIGAQMAPLGPDDAAEAARLFEDMGFDLIEINMACPAPKIARRGRGGALLRDPDLAVRVTESAVGATSRPVTVKMRSGLLAEDGFTSLELARRMADAGVAAVCLHPRSVKQLYKGRANWLLITEMVEALPVPVIGSGDLASGEAAVNMLRETRCAAVTLARGAVGNPWIFRDAQALLDGRPAPPHPSREEVLAAIREHCRLSAELGRFPGEYHTMRRILPKYAKKLRGHSRPMMQELADTRAERDWHAWKDKWGFAQ